MIPDAEDGLSSHAWQDGALDPANVKGKGEGLVAEDFGAFGRSGGGDVGEGVRGCSEDAPAVESEGLGGRVGRVGVDEDVERCVQVDVGELERALQGNC